MSNTYQQLHAAWRSRGHPYTSRKRLAAFQEHKLRRLIHHAHQQVPYYRNLFESAGIRPAGIRTLDDLRKIPITDKSDLRSCPLEDVLVRGADPERLTHLWTSGSSGRPLVVYRSALDDLVGKMHILRAMRSYGLRMSDRYARVTMGPIPSETVPPVSRIQHALRAYKGYPVRAQQPAEEILRQLQELDANAIVGFPSTLAQVALLVRAPLGALRFIVSVGEALTPIKRRAIEQGFGARVYDLFGVHECSIVAWECPEQGLYHVADDNIAIEVLRDGRPAEPGEKGEVILTTLHCLTMPFIRYRLGDMVIKGPTSCPCGQPFSTLERIMGRVRDYLLLPDGRRVHALDGILSVITSGARWLNQYQLTQETRTDFVLRIVPRGEPIAAELEAMQGTVAENLGKGAKLRVELVREIPFEESGKFKDCRSLLTEEPD